MNERERRVVGLLFDWDFTSFITKKLVRLLYMVGVAAAGLMALSVIVSGFSLGAGSGLLALILSPILFLVAVAVMRIQLELVIVLFRIEENTRGARGPRIDEPVSAGGHGS